MKVLRAPLIVLVASSCLLSCAPEMSGVDNSPINMDQGPLKSQIPSQDTVSIPLDSGGSREIRLLNQYRIGAMVLGHRDLSFELVSTSLGMVWGRLAEQDVQRSIDWGFGEHDDHAGFRFELQHGAPVDGDYVKSHYTFIGVIPANERIRTAASTLTYGDFVELNGYQVDWNADSADVIYITKIRVKGMVFE